MRDAEQLAELETRLLHWLRRDGPQGDPSHDIGHVIRVWRTGRLLAEQEEANLLVVLPAALLHDCVNVPKGHPDRPRAASLSADKAEDVLKQAPYPAHLLPDVRHAIEAHSYSAGVEATTLEAKIVQDADRLESLGAIGIARCFVVTGLMGRPIADMADPLATRRELNDYDNALDHFEVKLLRLPALMNTATGRRIAEERAAFMRRFRDQLVHEITGNNGAEIRGSVKA